VGAGAGAATGSAAVAEIKTLTAKNVTRKHTVKVKIVFII
jgi:hypothetical protein